MSKALKLLIILNILKWLLIGTFYWYIITTLIIIDLVYLYFKEIR